MNTIFSIRTMKRLALITAPCTAFISAVHADDLNIKITIPSVPQTNTGSYILIDYNFGKVLAEQDADVCRGPASLTKVMTSRVVGQTMKTDKFKETDLATIGSSAWTTGNPVFKGSLLMSLKPGTQVPVSQSIRGINLQLGDDARVVMADFVTDSRGAFAGPMNSYANVLGLKNTHFQMVYGLDANGQYSSIRDVALTGQALIHDVLNEYLIYKEKEFMSNGTRQLNRNGLLQDNSLNVDGIRTGYTGKTNYSPIAPATKDQMRLVSAVMGERILRGREAKSKRLLTWDFRFFEIVNLLEVGKEFTPEPT